VLSMVDWAMETHNRGESTCVLYMLITRDETIRSSHATKRIDTKGDDMVIFDTIRYDTDNRAVSGISGYRLFSDTPELLYLTDDLYFPGAHDRIKQTSFSGFRSLSTANI